jgi:HSP20 family molecular chaperone IbpA
VQVALPGWEPNQVNLEMKDKMLTVWGERAGEESGQYHVREIADGSFSRVFALPASIDHEKKSCPREWPVADFLSQTGRGEGPSYCY